MAIGATVRHVACDRRFEPLGSLTNRAIVEHLSAIVREALSTPKGRVHPRMVRVTVSFPQLEDPWYAEHGILQRVLVAPMGTQG